MAKVLRCEDFMVKCPYMVHGATEEELLREATTHLAEIHHIKELTPAIVATVQRNIRTE
jgi:predicted small metal-binding protein